MVRLRHVIEEMKDPACRERLLDYYSDVLDLELDTSPPSEDVLKMLRALSNPIRLRILMLVSQLEMPVCLITLILGEDQSLISHHLRVLKDAGLVKVRSEGRFRFYSLNDEALEKLVRELSPHRRQRGVTLCHHRRGRA